MLFATKTADEIAIVEQSHALPVTVSRPTCADLVLYCFTIFYIFTVRHVMQRTVLLSQFCPSVRLSVRLSVRCVYCDKIK